MLATQYFNYQTAGSSHALFNKGVSPALLSVEDYVMSTWSGGMDLGDFGVRNVKGGTQLSTHSFGAAWDWRYMNPGPGRAMLLSHVLPFLITHSAELGIQMIVDYVGCRTWKASRSGDQFGGWKAATPGSTQGMGASWAGWIHIEIHPSEWHDSRSVEVKLGIQDMPIFMPEKGLFSLWPFSTIKPVLRIGSAGDAVGYLQGVLRHRAGHGIVVDRNFGSNTRDHVKWFQASRGLVADGVVGRQTWAAIDKIAK